MHNHLSEAMNMAPGECLLISPGSTGSTCFSTGLPLKMSVFIIFGLRQIPYSKIPLGILDIGL